MDFIKSVPRLADACPRYGELVTEFERLMAEGNTEAAADKWSEAVDVARQYRERVRPTP